MHGYTARQPTAGSVYVWIVTHFGSRTARCAKAFHGGAGLSHRAACNAARDYHTLIFLFNFRFASEIVETESLKLSFNNGFCLYMIALNSVCMELDKFNPVLALTTKY